MYELAIRYSFGKPAIVIAEEGTKLPFDVTSESTIFYNNDPTGAENLKISLIKYESKIDYNKEEYGPIYGALKKASVFEKLDNTEGDESNSNEMLKYIMGTIEKIERKVDKLSRESDINIYNTCSESDYFKVHSARNGKSYMSPEMLFDESKWSGILNKTDEID